MDSIVDMPETEVHPRGEDCKDEDLEIFEEGMVCGVRKYHWHKDVRGREKQTTYIVEYIVLHQGSIEWISRRVPVLYSTYECEGEQSQLKDKQQNKRQVQLDTARGPVAACDTWDAWDRATREILRSGNSTKPNANK